MRVETSILFVFHIKFLNLELPRHTLKEINKRELNLRRACHNVAFYKKIFLVSLKGSVSVDANFLQQLVLVILFVLMKKQTRSLTITLAKGLLWSR